VVWSQKAARVALFALEVEAVACSLRAHMPKLALTIEIIESLSVSSALFAGVDSRVEEGIHSAVLFAQIDGHDLA